MAKKFTTLDTTLELNGKGYFQVEFEDGRAPLAIYDKTLAQTIDLLSRLQNEPESIRRIVKNISWVEEI